MISMRRSTLAPKDHISLDCDFDELKVSIRANHLGVEGVASENGE
jgi:hypothetical protein